MFTKTGKKGEEKMQKRKTAKTVARVERERERELCLGKTERVFRVQKLEKTGKRFNIKSRLFRNGRNILGNSRAFYITKMHLKISAKNKYHPK